MDSFSLSDSFLDLSPATTSKALGLERDVLGADAQEAADADDVGENLAVLVEQDVADVADLLVVGAEHVGALEVRREVLIRTAAN